MPARFAGRRLSLLALAASTLDALGPWPTRRQRGAGHDDAGVALEQPAAQKFRHVNRRGVQREILLRLAAAFHPVNVVGGTLFEERLHFLAQLVQPPVALDQFLPDVLVLAQFDQIADGFAQALNRQRDVVLHQFGAADAQFRPGAAAFRRFRRRQIWFCRRISGFLRTRLRHFQKTCRPRSRMSATSFTAPPLRKVASRPFSVRGFHSRFKA